MASLLESRVAVRNRGARSAFNGTTLTTVPDTLPQFAQAQYSAILTNTRIISYKNCPFKLSSFALNHTLSKTERLPSRGRAVYRSSRQPSNRNNSQPRLRLCPPRMPNRWYDPNSYLVNLYPFPLSRIRATGLEENLRPIRFLSRRRVASTTRQRQWPAAPDNRRNQRNKALRRLYDDRLGSRCSARASAETSKASRRLRVLGT